MKTYLLEITRFNRAERPSESMIKSDSEKINGGDFITPSQKVDEDTYLIFTGELYAEAIRIMSTQQFNAYALAAGNGWRVIEYPYSERWTFNFDIAPNSTVEVKWEKEGNFGIEYFNDIESSLVFIDELNDSDGFVLIEETEDRVTKVIYSRPSLWIKEGEKPIMGQKNLGGRLDTDRF